MFYSIDSISPVCQELHRLGKTVVLATGFFDLLHVEHINFLQKAKAAGDILVVAVESDQRAAKLKGEGRPIEPQEIRCQHIQDLTGKLENWKTGLLVLALPDDFDHQGAYESLLVAVRPQIYAVSSNTEYKDSKQLLTEKYGGKLVVVHTWNPAISTTQIIQNANI